MYTTNLIQQFLDLWNGFTNVVVVVLNNEVYQQGYFPRIKTDAIVSTMV